MIIHIIPQYAHTRRLRPVTEFNWVPYSFDIEVSKEIFMRAYHLIQEGTFRSIQIEICSLSELCQSKWISLFEDHVKLAGHIGDEGMVDYRIPYEAIL